MKRAPLIGLVLVLGALVGWALWTSIEDGSTPSAESDGPGSRPGASGPASSVPSSLTVAGRVLDPTGKPVPGAEVFLAREGTESMADEPCDCPTCRKRLLDCGCNAAAAKVALLVGRREGEWQPDRAARSDGSGSFTFKDVPRAALTVWASSAGFAPAVRHGLTGDQPVELILGVGRAIAGRVLDEQERPVAGALVTAVPSLLPRFVEGVAAADGAFRLEGLGEGPHYLTANAPGFLPTGLPLQLAGTRSVTLTLPRPRTLVGVVREGKLPARGASVRLFAEHQTRRLEAGDDGTFRIEGLFPGEYNLAASKGRRVASKGVQLADALTRVELALADGLVVRGRVFDDAGAPLPDATVSATLDARRLLDSRSDAEGRFALEGVPAGARVTASHDGFEPASGAVDAEGAEIELVLRAQTTVTGVVLSAQDLALPGVQVVARGSGRGVTTSDAKGAFRLALPNPGPVSLLAHHSSFGAGEVSVEAPASGVKLRLNPLGGLRARLVDETGKPVVGGRATAWRDDAKSERVDTYSSDEPSGEDGALVLAGLPSGPHRVRFTAKGYQPAERRPVPIPESGSVDLGDVALEAGKEISGVVLKEDGSPAAGAFVHARAPTNRAAEGVAVGKDGSFTLVGLLEGTYQVAAFLDKSVAEVSARTGDRSVTIRLSAPSRVSGRVVDEAGRPLPRFFVDGTPVEADDGRFDVSVRAYRDHVFFRVGATGRLTVFKQAQLGQDGVADAGDVVLEQASTVEGTVVDESGAPLGGAAISVGEREELRARDEAPIGAVSRPDGRFRLEGLSAGPATLVARRGSLITEQLIDVPAGGLQGVVLTLQAKGAIEGVVRGGDGKPASAELYTTGGATSSDSLGRYRLDGLVQGQHTVMAILDSDSFRTSSQQVEVQAGETVHLDFDLTAGGTLVVSVPGAATGTVHLLRSSAPTGGLMASQTGVVTNGEAVISGLIAGPYTVLFVSEDQTAEGSVDVAPSGTTRLVLAPRSLEGSATP